MIFTIRSKSFGARKILGELSLRFVAGEVTALLGPSGIGKTSLLRIIAGLDQDDSGEAQPRYRIGMVFQEPRLLPWKTVAENINLFGPGQDLLERLGLEQSAGLYPRQLSLGMARRLALARALAVKPELLILDEPFASLDAKTAQNVRQVVREFSAQPGMATVLVTHDPRDTAELARHSYTLSGTPALLVESNARL